MIKCLGYENKAGVFEKDGKSIAYDNIILHYTSDNNPNVIGTECGTIKIKREQFPNVCKSPVGDLIGKEIHVSYQPIGGKLQIVSIMAIK